MYFSCQGAGERSSIVLEVALDLQMMRTLSSKTKVCGEKVNEHHGSMRATDNWNPLGVNQMSFVAEKLYLMLLSALCCHLE